VRDKTGRAYPDDLTEIPEMKRIKPKPEALHPDWMACHKCEHLASRLTLGLCDFCFEQKHKDPWDKK